MKKKIIGAIVAIVALSATPVFAKTGAGHGSPSAAHGSPAAASATNGQMSPAAPSATGFSGFGTPAGPNGASPAPMGSPSPSGSVSPASPGKSPVSVSPPGHGGPGGNFPGSFLR